jgi:hypothetical protein
MHLRLFNCVVFLTEREPLDVLPVMFGRTFDLAVQINADGFHIAVDG